MEPRAPSSLHYGDTLITEETVWGLPGALRVWTSSGVKLATQPSPGSPIAGRSCLLPWGMGNPGTRTRTLAANPKKKGGLDRGCELKGLWTSTEPGQVLGPWDE